MGYVYRPVPPIWYSKREPLGPLKHSGIGGVVSGCAGAVGLAVGGQAIP
jgi:hypothetical protein